jgi:hypothetical protein
VPFPRHGGAPAPIDRAMEPAQVVLAFPAAED